MADKIPTGEELQIASLQVLHSLREHAASMTEHVTSLTDYVAKLDARIAGAAAVAEVVDENQEEVETKHWVAAKKEVVSFLYGESQKYTTVVIAGGFVAFFTMFSATSTRLNDDQLRVSAFLMTISLAIFVLYEVLTMAGMSVRIFRGTLEQERDTKWARRIWALAMCGTLLTALPAIWLSLRSYVEGLDLGRLAGVFFG